MACLGWTDPPGRDSLVDGRPFGGRGGADPILRQIRPDIVFHLASHVSGDRALGAVASTLRDNLVTTVNLLTAAAEAGGTRVVLAGSMEESAPDDPVPSSPYAAAKTAASAYDGCSTSFTASGRQPAGVHGLRAGPAGRHQARAVRHQLAAAGRGPRLSSGKREVDWVYVDDVVAAFAAAAEATKAPGNTLDVGLRRAGFHPLTRGTDRPVGGWRSPAGVR